MSTLIFLIVLPAFDKNSYGKTYVHTYAYEFTVGGVAVRGLSCYLLRVDAKGGTLVRSTYVYRNACT